MNTLPEMLQNPQVRQRGLVIESKDGSRQIGSPLYFTRQSPAVAATAPSLGAHTEQILREAGLRDEEISEFESQRVIKIAEQ